MRANHFPKYNRNFLLLLKVILEMSEVQQQLLLQEAVKINNKRQNARIPCLIYAAYRTGGRAYRSFILNINDGGAFIETDGWLTAGRFIHLSFFDPFANREIRLMGRIVRRTGSGIGVHFARYALAEEALKDFLIEFKRYKGQEVR